MPRGALGAPRRSTVGRESGDEEDPVYLLVCVLDAPAHLSAVLDGWTEAGVLGITVLESIGVQ